MLPRPTRHIATIVAALAFGVAATPAHAAPDPLLRQQWALSRSGAIGAPEAWTQSLGAGVLVAVLDSGVQLDHPDLAANLWRNPDEVAGNGIDDDRNGYVDDVHGANMQDGNGNVDDDDGHGTHVAGHRRRAGRGQRRRRRGHRARARRSWPSRSSTPTRSGDSALLATRHPLRGRPGREDPQRLDQRRRDERRARRGDAPTPSARARRSSPPPATTAATSTCAPSYPASSPEPGRARASPRPSRPGALADFANRGLRSVDLAAPGAHILSTAPGGALRAAQRHLDGRPVRRRRARAARRRAPGPRPGRAARGAAAAPPGAAARCSACSAAAARRRRRDAPRSCPARCGADAARRAAARRAAGLHLERARAASAPAAPPPSAGGDRAGARALARLPPRAPRGERCRPRPARAAQARQHAPARTAGRSSGSTPRGARSCPRRAASRVLRAKPSRAAPPPAASPAGRTRGRESWPPRTDGRTPHEPRECGSMSEVDIARPLSAYRPTAGFLRRAVRPPTARRTRTACALADGARRARARSARRRWPPARHDLPAAGHHVRHDGRRRPDARAPVPAGPRPADPAGERVDAHQARPRAAHPRAEPLRRRRLPRARDRPRGHRPVAARRQSRSHFARAAHGIRPPGGVYCHVAGCDLVRDADGSWKVLEDNVRTPSGISYVLENRVAMTRLLPGLFNRVPGAAGRPLPACCCSRRCAPSRPPPRARRPSSSGRRAR